MQRAKSSPAAQEVKVASLHKDRPKYAGSRRSEDSAGDDEPLSPETIRELRRRLRDSRDPLRYMLVSEFGRRFMLYYNVSSHTFAMNEPGQGTLFKRREAAESVKKLLSKAFQSSSTRRKEGD